jgi:endo-1,4-beta-xylanase
MIVGEVPTAEAFAAQMRNFTELGLEVAITELDVRMILPETDALLAQQKADYTAMITGCMMVEKCVGMTVWDFTDK